MTEREKLIDELSKTIMVEIALSGQVDVEKIADFIEADRKRIVAPLVKHLEGPIDDNAKCEAIDETLRLAGAG